MRLLCPLLTLRLLLSSEHGDVADLLHQRGLKPVSYEDWLQIQKVEIEQVCGTEPSVSPVAELCHRGPLLASPLPSC